MECESSTTMFSDDLQEEQENTIIKMQIERQRKLITRDILSLTKPQIFLNIRPPKTTAFFRTITFDFMDLKNFGFIFFLF